MSDISYVAFAMIFYIAKTSDLREEQEKRVVRCK